jgi:hypothetical protein
MSPNMSTTNVTTMDTEMSCRPFSPEEISVQTTVSDVREIGTITMPAQTTGSKQVWYIPYTDGTEELPNSQPWIYPCKAMGMGFAHRINMPGLVIWFIEGISVRFRGGYVDQWLYPMHIRIHLEHIIQQRQPGALELLI